MKKISAIIARTASSQSFFLVVMAIFSLQALWIALTAAYPMAFDEDFHFGLIKLHADQLWLPFFANQPNGADMYGAVVRDPSYFYQYLMAFPYRLIATFISDEMTQIVLLRLVNIGLFAGAIILFRKVLLKLNVSRALAHSILFFFVLIPIVPLLAGQINYDNLLILFVAWACLLALLYIEDIQSGRLPLKSAALLIIVCLLASITKYAFLPLLAASVIFLAGYTFWQFRHRLSQLRSNCMRQLREAPRLKLIVIAAFLLLSAALFAERYGINAVVYKSPTVNCADVLNEERCMQSELWERNYTYIQSKPQDFTPMNVVDYSVEWFYGMWYRLFFTINGNTADQRYQSYPPLPLPSLTAVVIGACGGLATLFYWRRLFAGNPQRLFIVVVIITYVGTLFYKNYSVYVNTGVPVALNGRYLLLVMIPVMAIIGLSLSRLFRRALHAKSIAVFVATLLFVNGGGIISFLLYSDDAWYITTSSTIPLTRTVQEPLRKVITGVQF